MSENKEIDNVEIDSDSCHSLDDSDTEIECNNEKNNSDNTKESTLNSEDIKKINQQIDINSIFNDQLKNMDSRKQQDFMKLFNSMQKSPNFNNMMNLKPQSSRDNLRQKLQELKMKRSGKNYAQNQLNKIKKNNDLPENIEEEKVKKKKKKKKIKVTKA